MPPGSCVLFSCLTDSQQPCPFKMPLLGPKTCTSLFLTFSNTRYAEMKNQIVKILGHKHKPTLLKIVNSVGMFSNRG